MAKRRVVITGMGCISPVGNTVEEAWENVKNGKSGVGKITLFDASRLPVKIAAEVKNFDIEKCGLDKKVLRQKSRFTQLCLGASAQAIADAGYTAETLKGEKTGVLIGNVFGGVDTTTEAFSKINDPATGPERMPPLTAAMMISNEGAANVCIQYGINGFGWALNTACASGSDALGLAMDMIRSGRIDMCVAGGTEATVEEFTVGSFVKLQALSKSHNDDPEKACRPFDKDRDGFIVGEGSVMFMLEELEHAKARGAKIYAELAGFGTSNDAYHITSPLKDGSGAAMAVKDALEDAGLKPEDIQYYNAHGTSTHANDVGETAMLKLAFGEHAYKLHISSTKSMTGHLVGAAGAIEAMFCVKAINEGFVPPTINLDNPDLEGGCDLDYTPNVGVKAKITAAASASLGFGGHNGCVVITKYKE